MTSRVISRRRLLADIGSTAVVAGLGAMACPGISRAGARPVITHGVQSGDVSADSGVVWARTDRPARMLVEASTTDSFRTIHARAQVDALPAGDFTAKALLTQLPSGQDIFYRIRFQDLATPTVMSEPVVGHFRSPPQDRRSITFLWSGDTAGQGWGIDEARGGMRTYATMLANRPDFFIHCGDTIYADAPISAEVKLPDGTIWKNLTIEEKAKAAETLAEFRANFKYNLLDGNVRAFNAAVPLLAQWDDHEVYDNWWPGEPLPVNAHRHTGYGVSDASILAARARRAFHEFMPLRPGAAATGRIYRRVSYGPLLDVFMLDMRSYRGPNDKGREERYGPSAYLLGPAQVEWLKRGLKASRATWKVIVADMPLGLVVHHDFARKWGVEAVAQGDGPPLGRELEVADLLAFLKRAGIRNTVWLTADVHYTAAHHYDPSRAIFQEFEPFWEFVSGPIHAGTFGPNALDNTFGPQVVYQKVPAREQGQNLSPAAGMQFFGHVAIDGARGIMKVTLKDVENRALWSIALEPKSH